MFKELKSLGVVVKELSNELRQLVSNSELFKNGLRLLQVARLFLNLQFHQHHHPHVKSVQIFLNLKNAPTAKRSKLQNKKAGAQKTHLTLFVCSHLPDQITHKKNLRVIQLVHNHI